MNSRNRNVTNMLGGAHRFCLDHPLVPPVAKATALITEVGNAYTTMLSLGSAQSGGAADWQNGTDQRSVAARALRDMLRDIVETARSLDAELYPQAGAIRMPPTPGLQALRDRSQAVLTAIGAIKSGFAEMDWAADFDEKFAALIAAYDMATGDQCEGRSSQIAGTAGLYATAKAGVKAVRKLNAIMRRRLKSDPGLLAAWEAVTHIQTEPVREDEEEPETPTVTTVTTASVDRPAIAGLAAAGVNLTDETSTVALNGHEQTTPDDDAQTNGVSSRASSTVMMG